MRKMILAVLAAGTCLSVADIAQAQETGDDQASGVIIVTAQRRSENVLDVPLSITAQTGETLEASGIKDLTSFRFTTPGYSSGSGTGYTQAFIRGIGNRIYVGADPSVATFIDDVPRVYASLNDQLLNVERVEILKGAQGGLYGRNATGGVINIITRQPGDAFAVEGSAAYGTKNTLELNGYVNVPLTDNVAANLTVNRSRHDDYTPNKAIANPYATYAAANPGYTGTAAQIAALDSVSAVSPVNNQDVWSVDGKIAFKGDGFKVTLAGDYAKDHDDYGAFAFQRDPASAYGTYAYLMGLLGFGAATLPQSAVFPTTSGKFDALVGYNSFTYQEDYGASAKAEIELPGFDLTSITAFRWNRSQFNGDLGAAAVPIAGFYDDFHRRNQYQELRAVSNGDGPFSWLAGATFYHENIDYLLQGVTLGFLGDTTTSKAHATAWSIYGQGAYELTGKLKLTASLRWVTETKVADYPAQNVTVYNPGPDGTPFTADDTYTYGVAVGAATASTKADKLLPSVTLSYALPGSGTVYARWAKGLKTGGVNPIVHPDALAGMANVFRPEKVDTYEVGLRTPLAGGKVDLTTAVFYNDYRDLQLTRTGYAGLPFYLVNAPSARTWGAEANLDWRVAPGVSFNANIGYLDAKYKDFSFAGAPDVAVLGFNYDGQRMLYAPKWQGGASLHVDRPISDKLNVEGTVLYSYSSSYDVDLNAPLTSQDAYSLVNLRVGVKTSDDRIGVYLNARNVFNTFYAAFGQRDAVGSEQLPGAPRVITGEVQFKF